MIRRFTYPVRSLFLRLSSAGLIIWLAVGCAATPKGSEVVTMPGLSGVTRRKQLQETQDQKNVFVSASQPSETVVVGQTSPATHPAGETTTQPSGVTDGPQGRRTLVAGAMARTPLLLNTEVIVQRVFDTSPTMKASREQMVAAKHGLEEFRANLSRLEPYVEASGDTAAYPERRDATGRTGEVVGGLQKETFEGAVVKVEGGASASEFEYGEVERGQESSSRGSGGLVRTRLEVPFIGSRRRQERVINQAFQESQSRKARLDYLSDFRTNVTDALTYYLLALLEQDYASVAEDEAKAIETLLKDSRIKALDRARLVSTMESCRVTRDQYRTAQRTYVLLLLSTLGLPMEQPVVLAERSDKPSAYLDRLSTPEGRDAMIQEACENNPRFRVLQNAIHDAELQRRQAIVGRYDVTTFMQGTLFPFGAADFDDRLGGWLVGGGVNVRLNDNRVLTASRLKAEAQIRQYKAEMEAERLTIQRKITDNGEQLQSYQKIGAEAYEVARKKEAAYRRRADVFAEGSNPQLMVDDLLQSLGEWTVAENRLAANRYYIGLAELQLMTASGEMYRMAGMDIDQD